MDPHVQSEPRFFDETNQSLCFVITIFETVHENSGVGLKTFLGVNLTTLSKLEHYAITNKVSVCLTGLESAVWQLTIFVFIFKTD